MTGHPFVPERPTAQLYWVDAGDLERGLGTLLHRRRPEEPGAWVEVEVALLPEVRVRFRPVRAEAS